MKFTENKKKKNIQVFEYHLLNITYWISFVKTTLNRISNIELSDLILLEAIFLCGLSTYTGSV